MNNNLIGILQQIANEYGEDILNNPKRVRGLLADMAAREPKAEKKALEKCFEMGFYIELKNSKKTALQKGVLIDRLQNQEGFAMELCKDSVDIITALIQGTKPSQPSITSPNQAFAPMINPEASVYFHRGNEYFKNRDFDNAIKEYTEAIKLNPKNWSLYRQRNHAYVFMGYTQKAHTDYSMAKKLRYIGNW
jgi:tetratricopeptide (TPR) repeat protein